MAFGGLVTAYLYNVEQLGEELVLNCFKKKKKMA